VAIAEGLLEYETLSGEEIKQLIAGQKPNRDTGDDSPSSRGSGVPKAGASRKKPDAEPEAGQDMKPEPQA
jgi:cell division protease FtsH